MYRNKKLTIAALAALFLAACGGGGGGGGSDDNDTSNNTSTTDADVTTSNYDVRLPDGVETQSISGDFDGTMVFAGSGSASSSAAAGGQPVSISSSGFTTSASVSSRDVAGFVADRPAPTDDFGATATDATQSTDLAVAAVNDVLGQQGTLTGIVATAFQEISRQSLLGGSIELGQFELTTSSNVKPTQVAIELVNLWGLNKAGGSVSGLPNTLSDESESTAFTVRTGVFYDSSSSIYIAVTIVATELAGTYETITSATSDPSNAVSKGTTLVDGMDSFTAQAGGNKADFLFAVDNSGSMGGEQTNLENAASAFSSALASSGLDFQLGVITTDSSALVGGGFTGDTATFESTVNGLGTGGSGFESAIFHAEQALQSGGSVVTAGFPRSGAQMSVVMISDEPDQYESYSAGGTAFNKTTNVFLTNGYIVHSIVDTDSSSSNFGKDYIDLANSTGGSRASIVSSGGGDLSESDFTQVMTAIAQKAGGASSNFGLSQTPVRSTIEVTNNGNTVTQSGVDGWSYDLASNSIVFNGNAVPAGGDQIKVTYRYAQGGSGGGGGSGGASFAGTWSGSSTTSSSTAACNGETDSGTITITDKGSGNFEIDGIGNAQFTGTLSGDTLTSDSVFQFQEDGGTTTVTSWSATLDSSGDAFSGSSTFAFTSSSVDCSGTSTFSATRQ